MQYSLRDVAGLFSVSENTVNQWVQKENLPAELVDSQYRFHRDELLEWATLHKLKCSPKMFQDINGDSVEESSLADALQLGGIGYRISGADKQAIFKAVIDDLPLPQSIDGESLLQLFLTREQLGSTAVGDGIAMPHPRSPVVLPVPNAVVRLCFLDTALDFQAPDGKPVDTLFSFICPTVHQHLLLLARLASVLNVDSVRSLLKERASEEIIIDAIRQAENTFRLKEEITETA